MRNFLPLRKIGIYSSMLVGFLMLESPVILLANQVEPTIVGIPFLFIWNLGWWAFLTALFLVAYLTNWGSKSASTPQKNQ